MSLAVNSVAILFTIISAAADDGVYMPSPLNCIFAEYLPGIKSIGNLV